jgi:DNA repair exonuclease SbcCD ATPase subunit
LQNFSILRATGALLPGTIPLVNRKELSEVVAEAAARTERAAALQQEARARQEAATAKLEEIEARREGEGNWMRQAGERQERMLQDYIRRTDEIVAESRARTEQIKAELAECRGGTQQIMSELKDQRDERRALIEVLLRLTDRLPPPPPHLRSA